MRDLFEENWNVLSCGQCKFCGAQCRRVDHKHVFFSKPFFFSYHEGRENKLVCHDFTPADYCRWLKEHWVSYEDYWDGEKPYRDTDTISLCLDGDFSVRYHVLASDFVRGTHLDPRGNPLWVEKIYYKINRKSPTGYELVHEYPHTAKI